MKRKIILIIAIILLLILILTFLNSKSSPISTITIYQTSCNLDDLRNSQIIKLGNLNIQLTDFFLNAQYPEDLKNISALEQKPYSCSQRLNFSSSNNIQSVLYDWIVYDNNGTILSTNIYGISNQEKNLVNYFNKTIFNLTDIKAYTNKIISSYSNSGAIITPDNPVSNTLVSSIVGIKEDGEYKYDFEQIHVLIINPKYQEYGKNNYIEFNDTIVEFIIN